MLTQRAHQAQDLIDRHIVGLKGAKPTDSNYGQFKRDLDRITGGDHIMYEACLMQYCSRSRYLSS